MEGAQLPVEWDDDAFEGVLDRLASGGTIDATGVRISSARLECIIEAAPEDPDRPGCPVLHNVDFSEATFTGAASFRTATFTGRATFDGATFCGRADFEGAIFNGLASFAAATFSAGASFEGATFGGRAYFRQVTLRDGANFGHATFSDHAVFERGALSGGSFSDATFGASANFGGGATFDGPTSFAGASFNNAKFSLASFNGEVEFQRATFSDVLLLQEATFSSSAAFIQTSFADAKFTWARFSGDVTFEAAAFLQDADFNSVVFERLAFFNRATIHERAFFNGVTFQGDVSFAGVSFEDAARFTGVTFERARDFGPVLARGALYLDGAEFAEPITIEADAGAVSCRRAQFHRGAELVVRRAEVALDHAEFAEPSTLALWAGPVPGEEERLGEGESPDGDSRPRVVSLRGAGVASLTIAGADLRACRFEGALGLDQLRIEADCDFAESPPYWHYARRRTLAEEHVWRAARSRRSDWCPPECHLPEWLDRRDPAGGLAPGRIAAIYRSLRAALESHKDEPGAADFYYGEMEMRRLKKPDTGAKGDTGARLGKAMKGSGERLTLMLYWLVSGYGLRASRALAALTITIVLGAVVLSLWGFDAGQHPDDGTLLFASETSISLLKAPDTENLTAAGHVVQIVLRLAGPLFFGLALLSLRGRVKR